MIRFLSVLIFLGCALPVTAEPKANILFGHKASGSKQKPASFGYYSKGCVAGAKRLPENGATWQAMRLSRNRNWGHPDMIAYLKRTSAKVAKIPGWKGLYIGDISQPRGGPMLTGHASHQLGLDADIWMLPPKRLNLTRLEREEISSISIRTKDQRNLNSNWRRSHMAVLKIAAKDPAVDRIFVTPPAKIWMCKNARGNKKWLRKIRPWWGHHYHFHVRLKCPKGSAGCKGQAPLPRGTGCKNLRWWVTGAIAPPDPDAPKKPPKRHPRDYTMVDLPKQCRAVLTSR